MDQLNEFFFSFLFLCTVYTHLCQDSNQNTAENLFRPGSTEKLFKLIHFKPVSFIHLNHRNTNQKEIYIAKQVFLKKKEDDSLRTRLGYQLFNRND